jgi:hypothetical protein
VIVVYQMAKVASRSWVEAANLAAPTKGSLAIHCHYAAPRNRERIEAVFGWPAAQQTIANMYLPRNLLRVGASVWERIESARRRQERIRVVSGMRDPVARSISLIVFMSDFYGHVSRPLSPRTVVSAEFVVAWLQENWRLVLEHKEPGQTFEWLLWYLTDGFRSWFAGELGATFGVNVMDGTFHRRDAAQRMRAPEADILIYRVEDMLPEAPRYGRLLAEANTFLETTLTSFPKVNSSSQRRSRELSAEVRRKFWLPADMLDAIYSEPVVQHFYDCDEILAFKKLWSASRLKCRC